MITLELTAAQALALKSILKKSDASWSLLAPVRDALDKQIAEMIQATAAPSADSPPSSEASK